MQHTCTLEGDIQKSTGVQILATPVQVATTATVSVPNLQASTATKEYVSSQLISIRFVATSDSM